MTKTTTNKSGAGIPDRLYFKIGDVAELVGVKPYVLRYWESEFPMLSPEKKSTGQRVYRRSDVETLLMIKHLLYTERYSIEGARRRIRELRKEGTLKDYREKAVAASGAKLDLAAPVEVAVDRGADEDFGSDTAESVQAAEVSSVATPTEALLRIRESARTLSELARKPITEIFRA